MSHVERYAQGTPSYVELSSPDQRAAEEFYGQLLGWDFDDVDMGAAGVYLAAKVGGESVAGIAGQLPHLVGHPAYWVVYLTVDDLDATLARVGPAGGTVEAGPFDVMSRGRIARIQEPTGARVNLWQAGETIGSVRVNEPGCPIWHELTTPDVATATRFYSDVLDVTWESMPTASGEDYTCLIVDGRAVAGAAPPRTEGAAPHWDVYFNVEDCDATVTRAVELGAESRVPPYDVPGVGRISMLRDPQGAVLGLLQDPADDA